MKHFFVLLKPFKVWFVLALLALISSAFFNAALTGMVAPLMNNVMTIQAETSASRADEIFAYKDKIEKLMGWLEARGVPVGALERHSGGPDLLNPLPWAMLVFLIFCLQALFDFMGTYTMARVGLWVVVHLRQSIIDRLLSHSMSFFKRFSTGEILTRINTDVLRVQNAISVKLGEMVKEVANSAVFLVLAFVINWKLSLTLFVLVPLVGGPIVFFTRKIRKYASKSQSFLGVLTGHFKEVLVGIRIVKGFGMEGFESRKLARENRSFLKYALRELKIVAMTTPIMSLIGILVILAFVCYGSLAIQGDQMTRGDFLFYVLVVYQLYQPIKRIARANSEIQQAVGVMPRIREFLDWQNEILEPEEPQQFPGYPQIQEIYFQDVGFHYDDQSGGEPVLEDIDLRVERGTVLALVGASGSGKSTMVSLLPRFYDVRRGVITINGLDIRCLAKTRLRELIGIVTQDTILFDDTVHNNIAYGLESVSRDRVIAAAKKAFAHPFICELKEGYESRIGEAGGNLSGGQKQRISIARAILKDAPILILDEATSALDTESEREVQMALENLMKEKTTFVIAHRLSTIRQAHHIVVMHRGRIVERGDHETLLAGKGIYRKLIQMQEEGLDAL